jgi:hypothetical protein
MKKDFKAFSVLNAQQFQSYKIVPQIYVKESNIIMS